jgi:RNA polymerase sigma-70 factor (ECF subfamily)
VLERARNGDRAAFGAIVRVHRNSVYSLALRLLGAREAAEDLAQDVFVRLHGKLASIESAEHLLFWLRRVTTHRAIDRLRHDALMVTTPLDAAPDLPSAATDDDPLLQRRLQRLLLALAPDARAVMTLRFQEDLDPVDIARVLDMPINTVKSHLKRSLGALRLQLAPAADPIQSENGP